MASRIIGIDLGAYSVKVVIVAPGFRTSSVVDYAERVVPPGDEPHEVRAARVVGQIVREHNLEHDTSFLAVAGNQVFIHILEFGFKNLRRADLARAVGAELEGILPIDLEDMVYAFEPLPRNVPPAVAEETEPSADDDPTFVQPAAPMPPAQQIGRVAPPTSGMRVLACAMKQERAREMLKRITECGSQPKGLVAVPAAYRRVAERVAELEGSKSGGPPVAIVDMGHARTDVCVIVDDKVSYVRTMSRGGQELTEAIASTWKLPWDRAEQAKHTDGFIASRALPAQSEAWQRIHQCLEPVLTPTARDLRRTLAACRAKTGATVAKAVLVGGGSRMNGMPEFLTEQLGIQVTRLSAADHEAILGPKLASAGVVADTACLAAGVAFEGATGRPQFDLRQGDLAYKADLSFLRAKAGQLIAAALVIIAFAAGSAYESTEAFGDALEAGDVLDKIGPTEDGKRSTPIPEMTAYDAILELNSTLPGRDEVNIDVTEIDIKSDKISLHGTAIPTEKEDALAGIDKFEEKLKKSKCFKDYTTGETQPGANDSREFSLTIKTGCK